MIRKHGISGGRITLRSFLTAQDRQAARDGLTRTASTRQALKEGLLSLYADPEDAIEVHKDFDLAQAMIDQKGKVLWVRARIIDADTVNANGDYFSKEELLKEVAFKGGKVPAYKTFEGVPIYTNHKNDDIELAKGKLVYAEWCEEENCVYGTFYIDEEAYPEIARGIRQGYMSDVSMGCQVQSGKCSKCGNIAQDVVDYCECLKNHKGKKHPKTNEIVYEENFDLKFIELSVVSDGAFDLCEIEAIYDADEVIGTARELVHKAQSISHNVSLAAANIPSGEIQKELEHCLRQAAQTANTAVRLAQQAGTLVGGQVLSTEGADQNTTVSSILHFLGLDPRSGLNLLDMLNLALNFLEVAVLNMFARKDNVDLTHVSKITKSMSDLQATMQDMIDDGVDTTGGASPPLNQQQLQQQQQQQAAPPVAQQQQQNQNYLPTGTVGRILEPTLPGISSQQPPPLVWASKDGRREVYASTYSSPDGSFRKGVQTMSHQLSAFAEVLQLENKNTGDTMDIFQKFANDRRRQQAVQISMDAALEDNAGNRIVLSSADGSLAAYHKNQRVAWDPSLTDTQLEAMEKGRGAVVAAELLKSFGEHVRTANWQPYSEDDVKEKELESHRKPNSGDKNRQDELSPLHKNSDGLTTQEDYLNGSRKGCEGEGIKENQLEEGWNRRRPTEEDVKDVLLEEARKGYPDNIIEEQVAERRVDDEGEDVHLVTSAVLKALNNTVVALKIAPEEAVEAAVALSSRDDLSDLIALAQLGAKARKIEASRTKLHKTASTLPVTPEITLIHALSNELGESVTTVGLAEAVRAASAETDAVLNTLTKMAYATVQGMESAAAPVKVSLSASDKMKAAFKAQASASAEPMLSTVQLRAALSAMASTAEDVLAAPDEIVAALNDTNSSRLATAIEEALMPEAVQARETMAKRKAVHGSYRLASKKDVAGSLTGWLADYAIQHELSSAAIADAAIRIAQKPTVAEKLITKGLEQLRVAATVRDEDTKSLTLICRLDELGGLDPQSESFNTEFRDKARDMLIASGYTIDPATFALTTVDITENGDVTATVSSSYIKTVTVGSVPTDVSPAQAAGENDPMALQMPEAPEDFSVEQIPTVMTAAAKKARKERRAQALARYAQAAPGMMGGMGAPGMMPMADPSAAMAPGMDASPGMSSMTAPTELGDNPVGEEESIDDMPEPGSAKAWGTVCPQCGSEDLDIANGEGACNSCGAQLKFTYSVEVLNPNPDKQDGPDVAPEGDLGMDDMGLGGATAPAPGMGGAMPPAPGMGGEMPPATPGLGAAASKAVMLVKVAYETDADVFIRTAQTDFNRRLAHKLPIGMICPSCGSRHAEKVKNITCCFDCGVMAATKITPAPNKPGKVNCEITWMA